MNKKYNLCKDIWGGLISAGIILIHRLGSNDFMRTILKREECNKVGYKQKVQRGNFLFIDLLTNFYKIRF